LTGHEYSGVKTMIDLVLRDQIIQRLLAASDAKLTASDVDDATSFQDLDLSSLILVTLAAELEDELGINIDDDELSRIQTIGDLFKVIENSQRQNRPA
jgi:acyl carrier protein